MKRLRWLSWNNKTAEIIARIRPKSLDYKKLNLSLHNSTELFLKLTSNLPDYWWNKKLREKTDLQNITWKQDDTPRAWSSSKIIWNNKDNK